MEAAVRNGAGGSPCHTHPPFPFLWFVNELIAFFCKVYFPKNMLKMGKYSYQNYRIFVKCVYLWAYFDPHLQKNADTQSSEAVAFMLR